MFAVTSATGSESRQWLKSSGLLTIRPGRVPPLSAYAYQSSVPLLLAVKTSAQPQTGHGVKVSSGSPNLMLDPPVLG